MPTAGAGGGGGGGGKLQVYLHSLIIILHPQPVLNSCNNFFVAPGYVSLLSSEGLSPWICLTGVLWCLGYLGVHVYVLSA